MSKITTRLMLICLASGLMSVPSLGDDAPATKPKPDVERIEGTWQVTSMEVDGTRAADEDARKFTVVNVKEGAWEAKSEGMVIGRGKSTFSQEKTPREVDIVFTDQNGQESRFHGIYELSDNSRRLCFAPEDFPRPTDFTSFPGTQRILLSFERVPKK